MNHLGSTLRLLQAGIIAAGRQLITIILVTVAAWFVSDNRVWNWDQTSFADIGVAQFLIMRAPFFIWVYLLTAVGFSIMSGHHIDVTAERIRLAARSMRPTNPTGAITIVLVQCTMCAIGLGIVSLTIQSEFFIKSGQEIGWGELSPLIRSAVFSIGVAGFGAIAHAACKALG